MADSRAQAYAEQLFALTREAEALTPEALRRILVLLDAANREILADLARTEPSSYTAARLQALKAQVDRVLDQFGSRAGSDVNAAQQHAYTLTAQSVDATVAAATGTLAVHPVVDQAMLQVAQGYSADLITGLTQEMSAKINAAIQRAYLGGSSLQQLVAQIGTELEGGHFSGLFSQVGERAMTIATNEIMRVHSLASMARINALAAHHPDLKKRWKHIPVAKVPRIPHILADNQVRKPAEPFMVGGEELQYPRDPAGTPGNTINCHCLVQPYFAPETLKPSDRERDLLKSYGLSVASSGA